MVRMDKNVKIDGIYDGRTIKELNRLRITHQSFDFRPKSFNFLQGYKLLELLEEHYLPQNFYYLHFQGEKEFVVRSILNDLNKTLLKRNPFLDTGLERVRLEFSDVRERSFYESFNLPYYWHYDPSVSVASYLGSHLLKGIVLSYSLLEGLQRQGTIYNFAQNLTQQIFMSGNQHLEIIVHLDWDADIFPSLFDLFDVCTISLPVNNKIEVCYRNVDVTKLSTNVEHYKNLNL